MEQIIVYKYKFMIEDNRHQKIVNIKNGEILSAEMLSKKDLFTIIIKIYDNFSCKLYFTRSNFTSLH